MVGLNSGVLLLHLERMRADDDVWARLLHAAVAKLEQQPPLVRLGWLADQTFVSFLAAWQFGANSLYPPHAAPLGDRLYTVPCGWNRQLSVHAANGPAPNFWPNWASCTEPCRFAQLYQCRQSAPGGGLITCLPRRAEGALCGLVRRRRRSPWPPYSTLGAAPRLAVAPPLATLPSRCTQALFGGLLQEHTRPAAGAPAICHCDSSSNPVRAASLC